MPTRLSEFYHICIFTVSAHPYTNFDNSQQCSFGVVQPVNYFKNKFSALCPLILYQYHSEITPKLPTRRIQGLAHTVLKTYRVCVPPSPFTAYVKAHALFPR